MFTVSRQARWIDGLSIVEITQGGIDYMNPDALVQKYQGEFQEFTDPVEAVEVAFDIARQWQADVKKLPKKERYPIYVAMGCTHGYTMTLDEVRLSKKAEKAFRKEAQAIRDNLPKCDQCGDILPDKYTTLNDFGDDCKFCDSRCAERWYEKQERINSEELEECQA